MENILQIIESNTTPKSGITVVSLAVKAGVSVNSIKPLLKEFEDQGLIKYREGINAKLIFKA